MRGFGLHTGAQRGSDTGLIHSAGMLRVLDLHADAANFNASAQATSPISP